MGRVLRLAWIPVALSVAAIVAVAVGAGNAPGAPAAPAANPTFTLVQLPKSECPAPKVILGKGCWDKSGQILSVYWSVNDGRAAWEQPDFTTTYEWSLPQTIGPSGAGIKLKLTASWKRGGLICPAFGPRGSFPLKETKPPQDPALGGICAKQDQPTVTASKTVTVLAISGGPGYITIGIQDGPQITYKYVVNTPTCRRLSSAAEYPELPYLVTFNAAHRGVPERGESPALAGSATDVSGKLTICTDAVAAGALASFASGQVLHNDALVVRKKRRIEKLRLKVTRGAYQKTARYEKLALDVLVTDSTDDRCPDGVVGRLVLTQDNQKTLADTLVLRLCGQNHLHTFRGADPDVQVKVDIRAKNVG